MRSPFLQRSLLNLCQGWCVHFRHSLWQTLRISIRLTKHHMHVPRLPGNRRMGAVQEEQDGTVLMTRNKKLSAYCRIIKTSHWWRGLLNEASGSVLCGVGIPVAFNLFLFHFTRSVAFRGTRTECQWRAWLNGSSVNESHRWLARDAV